MIGVLCIALVTAQEICSEEQWPNGRAVYYDPGSISFATRETLSYCFLEHDFNDELTVVSRFDCSLNAELTNRALLMLDRRRHKVDANLPDDWPRGIQPTMQPMSRILFRLHYFEPEQAFIAGMLKLVTAGKVLTDKQVDVVNRIKQEYGSPEQLRQRQHTRWRLDKLSQLNLEPTDQQTVRQFLGYARQVEGLRDSKLPVIVALEEKYWQQRLEETLYRALEINDRV